jgi:hypothetical protein
MLRTLWNDEAGVIISAELVLVLTIAVLAMIVGLSEVAVSINSELNDLSNAFGDLDQSYSYSGYLSTKDVAGGPSNIKAQFSGSAWDDAADDCDKNASVLNCSAEPGECG